MAATPESIQAQLDLDIARAKRERDSKLSAADRFDAGTTRGIAKTVGAPVDLVNSLLSVAGGGHEAPLFGSRNLQQILEKIGVGVPEEMELGRAGRVGEVFGASAPAAVGVVGAGARSLTAAAGSVIRQPKIATSLMQDIAKTATRNPVTFSVAEAAAATGAGLASYEAIQRWPDSAGAQAFAEILGGITPAVAMTGARFAGRGIAVLAEKAPLTGAGIRTVRGAIKSVSTSAQTRRAIERVQRATPDAGASARRIDRQDILPEASKKMTPIQKTGDSELLALERSVMEQSQELSHQQAKQFTEVNAIIRESLVSTPADDVPTHQVKAYFTDLLDTRIQQAAAVADEKLAALGARGTREDLNRLARQELDSAKRAARKQETQLYKAIPAEARVPTSASSEMLEHFRLTTPKAQRKDIPAEAVNFLRPTKVNAKGKVVANPNYLGKETTIEEMRGLQSSLREAARRAGADNRFNEARIANDMADSISDDIANAVGSPEVKEAVDIATAFSKDLNDRFTRGPVGKLLGSDRTGGARTDPSLTLESTVAGGGPREAVATDALLEAVRRNGNEPVMREHIEGFLIDDFRRTAVREGSVNPAAAQRWLSDNQDVLARFPELTREIADAGAAGGRLAEAGRLMDPKVSRAAVFIKAPPGEEVARVIRTAKPREAMQELAALAATDKSGKATEGLKAAFYEMLLSKSQVSGKLDLAEKPFVSGTLLTEQLNRDPIIEAARGLLTRGEIRRLGQIRETAVLMERARLTHAASEGVIGDQPNILFGILARVGGAQLGRIIAGRTGGGTVQTPGILSAQVQRLLQAGVQDPAKRLLTDSIGDESLFKAMLVPQANISPTAEKAVRARLNAWVTDVLTEQNEIEE